MKRGFVKKCMFAIMMCTALVSATSVAFLLPSNPNPKRQNERAWQGYEDLWVDMFDLDNPKDPGEYHFGDYGQILELANQIGSQIGGDIEALPSALQEMANGVDNLIPIDEEQILESEALVGGCGSISIGGFEWTATSIFTTDYSEDPESNTYNLGGENSRIIVTLVAPSPQPPDSEMGSYSRYHLAESDSPKNVRYNEYSINGLENVSGVNYAQAYVSAYTLGYGGHYFGELSMTGDDYEETVEFAGAAPYYGAWYTLNFDPEPQVRDFDLSLFNNGGMNRFIYKYYSPSLMTPKQYSDWKISCDEPCLLQTYTETLESDIQNYAPDYYDEYLGLISQKPEVANRTILLGIGDQIVPAMYTKEEIENPDPGYPGYLDGREVYAYDNEYLVVPCMQLDIAKTYVAATIEGNENYQRYTPPVDLDRKITLEYNDGTGRTRELTLKDGEWPASLGAPYDRFGYKFAGWYSERYGGFQVYDENGKFNMGGGNVLYARWLESNWEDWAADSYAGGLGTKESPYQIETAAQLAKLLSTGRDTEGKYYIQTSDINLAAHPWPGILFYGNYDGQNFGIYNIISLNNWDAALFYDAINATIKNVNIKSGTLNTLDGPACGIVSRAENVTIENCTNWVNCSSTSGSQSGGIVGILSGTSIIRSCINFGNIYSVSQFSTFEGTAGGIVGDCYGDVTIENCINMGDISATMDAGGIIGEISGAGKTVNIISCSSLGNLKSTGVTYIPFDPQNYATYYPGAGLVGFADLSSNGSKEDSTLNITACSIIGDISVAEGDVSPFCGRCEAKREEVEDEYRHVYHHKLNQVLTASYAFVNDKGCYTTALSDANWTKYWTISPAINSNSTLKRSLPVKKAFLKYFWVGDNVAAQTTTQAEFEAAFKDFSLLT